MTHDRKKKIDWIEIWFLLTAGFDAGLVAGSLVQYLTTSPAVCVTAFIFANPAAWVSLKFLMHPSRKKDSSHKMD